MTRADWVREQRKYQIKQLWSDTEGVFEVTDDLLIPRRRRRTTQDDRTSNTTDTLSRTVTQINVSRGFSKGLRRAQKILPLENMRRTCRHVNDTCALWNLLKLYSK